MNRRDLLLVGLSTAATHTLWTTAAGCGGAMTAAGAQDTVTTLPPDRVDALVREAAQCLAACEQCMGASIAHLEHGMSGMAACHRLSSECAALCRAVISLAANGSARLRDVALLCAASCDECAAQCAQHASHEPACARCAEACPRCAEACRAAFA